MKIEYIDSAKTNGNEAFKCLINKLFRSILFLNILTIILKKSKNCILTILFIRCYKDNFEHVYYFGLTCVYAKSFRFIVYICRIM